MKKASIFLITLVATCIGLASCSRGTIDDPGDWKHDNTTNLVTHVTHLDTITPPNNPLHPLPTDVQALPCFYGYLDLARYTDNKRYCALIGMVEEGDYVYFLTDSEGQLFRYDSPIVADCHVGELLYVRGNLTPEEYSNKYLLKLQVIDIERTDSIISPEIVFSRYH